MHASCDETEIAVSFARLINLRTQPSVGLFARLKLVRLSRKDSEIRIPIFGTKIVVFPIFVQANSDPFKYPDFLPDFG